MLSSCDNVAAGESSINRRGFLGFPKLNWIYWA